MANEVNELLWVPFEFPLAGAFQVQILDSRRLTAASRPCLWRSVCVGAVMGLSGCDFSTASLADMVELCQEASEKNYLEATRHRELVHFIIACWKNPEFAGAKVRLQHLCISVCILTAVSGIQTSCTVYALEVCWRLWFAFATGDVNLDQRMAEDLLLSYHHSQLSSYSQYKSDLSDLEIILNLRL
jgi:hypothetical protein